jgi:hypothetical protein
LVTEIAFKCEVIPLGMRVRQMCKKDDICSPLAIFDHIVDDAPEVRVIIKTLMEDHTPVILGT